MWDNLTAESVFETAVHSPLDRQDVQTLWTEYLFYQKSKALRDKQSMDELVNRCLMSVSTHNSLPHSSSAVWQDYRFHNQVRLFLPSRFQQTLEFSNWCLERQVWGTGLVHSFGASTNVTLPWAFQGQNMDLAASSKVKVGFAAVTSCLLVFILAPWVRNLLGWKWLGFYLVRHENDHFVQGGLRKAHILVLLSLQILSIFLSCLPQSSWSATFKKYLKFFPGSVSLALRFVLMASCKPTSQKV